MSTDAKCAHRRRWKVIAALTAPALLLIGMLGANGALATHDQNPACADITNVSGNWTRNTVDVDISLAGSSCTDVIYAVYVYDEPGDTGVIAGGAYSGDGVSTTEERYFTLRKDGLRGVRVQNGKAYACAVTYVSSDPTTALDTWGYDNPPPYACTGFELVHQ
jgi:hypothetical protein